MKRLREPVSGLTHLVGGLLGVFGFHELWHLFVVAGSACHFWAVLRYVAPLA